jgi:hypothetical protein
MQWQETTTIWPSCRPDQVPGELQNAINAVMASEGVPARARLRYSDPQTAKWRVFDVVKIADDDDEGEGFNERLAAFAVSAAIHLATTKGWEAFEFQVQPTDGVRCEQVLGDHEAKVRALIDAAARKRSPTAARPHADDLEVAIARARSGGDERRHGLHHPAPTIRSLIAASESPLGATKPEVV